MRWDKNAIPMKNRCAYPMAILALGMIGFMTGCTVLHPRPTTVEMTPVTRQLVSGLSFRNAALETFKGTGTLRIGAPGGNLRTSRIAWIGEAPDKLRLSALSIGGLPMATVAADGVYVFMASHAPTKFYKSRASNPNLDQLIGFDLHARDIIQILMGRVPMREFDHAGTEKDPKAGGSVLTLFNRRGRVIEKIHVSEDDNTPTSAALFDASGNPAYRLYFSNFRETGGFSIPFSIGIDNNDSHLLLKIDRYVPQPDTTPSVFKLRASDM